MSNKVSVNVTESSVEKDNIDSRWLSAHPPRERHSEILKEVLTKWSRFVTDESIAAATAFEFCAGDVVIATHSKSGTTMMQQIVHQLRSNGDMDFDEITEKVPFMEVALDCELDLSSTQEPHAPPRAYKTHMGWSEVPKTCDENGKLLGRYIYIARDFHSVTVSFYKFLLDWFYTAEEVRLCDFVEIFLYMRSTPYWDHIAGYYNAALEEKHQGSFLWMFFEDILLDQAGAVRAVADFIGIRQKCANEEEYEERIRKATEMSSFEFMKVNAYHFDEKITKRYRNQAIGAVSGGEGGQKVRAGGNEKASVALNDVLWDEIATVVGDNLERLLGIRTYGSLKEKATAELGGHIFIPQA